jgi:rod shape-determining protein MreD
MIKFAILVGLTFMVVITQTSVISGWGPPALKPDLGLLLVLTWGLSFGPAHGLIAALLVGPLLDAASGLPFGAHPLALVPVVLLSAARETDLFASRASLPFVLVPLATLGYYVVLAVLLQVVGRPLDWGSALRGVAAGMVLNAALSPFFYLVTSALSLRFGDQFRTVSKF